jgi:hypothetical protein
MTVGLETRLLALPWIDLPDSLETLGNLANRLQQLITAAIAHPVLAVIVLLLSIGLIQLAADLVKRTIQASLKFVLTLPLTLSQYLWKRLTTDPDSKQTKIKQLLDRLETLRQEQDQVIAELKPLLSTATSADSPNSNPKPPALPQASASSLPTSSLPTS